MDLLLILAIATGKLIAIVNKLTGSGATAAPGLYALKIDPKLVKKLTKNFKYGSAIVSGTNGKTTTSRIIFDILSTRYKIIHNRQGSNLLRGIASTLIQKSSLAGNIDADLGIWEIDEATLPEAIDNLSPEKVVLLNLFRDQLDRYGEVDSVRKKWQQAIAKLPKSATLILNADDPGISFLSKFAKGKSVFFGVNETKVNLPVIDHVADIKYCLNCDTKLIYKYLLSAHLGNYYCPNCGIKRPSPKVFAKDLKFRPDFSTSLKLNISGQLSVVSCHLPGLYNVYNILAASALTSEFGISSQKIKEKIQNFSTAFGRFQSVSIPASPARFDSARRAGGGNKSVVIFLIKNPAGANEVIRSLALREKLNLLVILNDKIADGKDVSWIWDTHWEILANKVKSLSIAGIRGWDMATRLKYANYKLSKNTIYKVIYYSILDSLRKMNNKDTLVILPTYTALLEVQRSLAKLAGGEKWHQQ